MLFIQLKFEQYYQLGFIISYFELKLMALKYLEIQQSLIDD